MKNLPPLRLLFTVLIALVLSACGTLDKTGAYQGDDILYKADLTITTSYQVLHGFVQWEYQNRGLLTDQPTIKQAADQVRKNAQTWIGSAIALREAYAANPTPETRQSLTSALLILQAAMNEATKYLAANSAVSATHS